jgi:hypothetical protein
MIIVSLIMPIVVGSIVLALVSLMAFQGSTTNRTSDAADAQLVSAYYEQDVQSSLLLTTNSSAAQCGVGTALLSFEWSLNAATGVYESVVSYDESTTTTPIQLFRNYCASGASVTATSSELVSSDMPTTPPVPVIVPTTSSTHAAAGWTTTLGVTGVTLTIAEPQSHYTYSLTSVPRNSVSSADLAAVESPNSSCGFATPGTGTYAASLCYVDFSSYNYLATPPGCGGNAAAFPMAAAITNTPYVLSFCIAQTGATVAPAAIPTYNAAPVSEAFLGNNGFYTNIPGDPALYQTTEGTTSTISLTNIKLLDANGDAATGWQLATGDAESTDAGESITWKSDQDMNLLPNTPTSQYGNACLTSTLGNDLTGVGGMTVECAAGVSSDKTGTVMLSAPAPTTLSATMVGAGLEAIFVGVLL